MGAGPGVATGNVPAQEQPMISLSLSVWMHIQDAVRSQPGDFTALFLFHLVSF